MAQRALASRQAADISRIATMWQKEVDKRRKQKPQPKQEWALITFVQQYMEKNPNATKTEVNKAWHKKRMEMVTVVKEYF